MEDNLVRKIPNPTVAQILDAYVFEEDEVERRWHLYLRGDLLAIEAYREPVLEVIPVSDLELSISGEFDEYEFVYVGRYSDMWSLNFVAYHARRRCYAFKGEMRLLKLFLAFVGEFFSTHRIEVAFVKPNCLMFPLDGLNEGFTHQDYQDKIKIAECVLFLRDGPANVSPSRIRAVNNAAARPSSAAAAGANASSTANMPNGIDILASTASIVRDDRSNSPEEQEEENAHWRYFFRQRNRPNGSSNGSNGANGANGASSSNAPGASNGRRS
ncbi:hypothetical protein TOPH_09022 [Tolypocladium ophioglossoides CBS 100239]|uniref:Uncharacterized protein n=1 Tax=Tolypocladium ophioglossoides (strain CBS 100239) TaxID=1163406 RepID=A0A0L0MWR4_TOLOC|nr:hypothetical protein TOPH_09022 [Tolypocladium ophioglossoides CBS 100239]